MTEKQTDATVVAEVKPKNLPKILALDFEGYRSGIKGIFSLEQALTPDGKLDRDAILRAGRLPDTFTRYALIADGKVVAMLTVSEKAWTAHFLDDKGAEVSKAEYDRTKTKSAKSATSKKPDRIDRGPDLFGAVNKLAQTIWPDLKATTRATKAGGGKKLKDRLEEAQNSLNTKDQQVMTLLTTLAQTLNVSIEDAAKQMKMELPQSYLKAQKDAADEAEAEAGAKKAAERFAKDKAQKG